MKRVFSGTIATLFVAALTAPLFADATTIKGEVIDVQCHAKDMEKKGETHESCAMVCAKKGGKIGVLTDDGVYTITGDYAADKNAKLLEFVAKNVEAKGEVTEHDGMKMIDVKSMKLQDKK